MVPTLHYAAKNNTLKDIPKHLFTEEALTQFDDNGSTVWHIAAANNTLQHIPTHLFTVEAFNQMNKYGSSVWDFANNKHSLIDVIEHQLPKVFFDKTLLFHDAAVFGKLKYINLDFFTHEAMNKKDKDGKNVLSKAATWNRLTEIPKHLITKDLVGDVQEYSVDDRNYITHVLAMPNRLTDFIKENTSLERAIELRDTRLVLDEASRHSLIFKFRGIKDSIILNKKGAFLNNEKFDTLHETVAFIENTYPNIEQSIPVPYTPSLKVEQFNL